MLMSSADFFKINFFEKFFQEHYQSIKQNVGPDLDINCLQRLSAEDKSHLKELTLNAPIAAKSRLLFSSAEMFKKLLRQTVWTQIRLLLYIGAVCSGYTLFFLLNLIPQ